MSSDGIATALKTSASALMEAGNDLEQSTALVAAANKVVQDPSSVGSALRTISLRLRGTSVEVLQQMGEETDGVAESTSKLQSKLKALTGVDILTNAGEYKDTYTILREIGEVWKDMGSMDQAAALELMAGKNRANTLAAILNNMEDLEGAYESAMNAEGSSLEENAAYMDSIQGHIDQFNNAVQTMWMNFMNSDVLKFIIDFGTGLINIIDKVGVLSTAIAGVLTYLSISKDNNFDLASALGIHDLEKGWSVFGKEGLTGKVAGWFDKDKRAAKKQEKAAESKGQQPKTDVNIQRQQEEVTKEVAKASTTPKKKEKKSIFSSLFPDKKQVKVEAKQTAETVNDFYAEALKLGFSKEEAVDWNFADLDGKLAMAQVQLEKVKKEWNAATIPDNPDLLGKDQDALLDQRYKEMQALEAKLNELRDEKAYMDRAKPKDVSDTFDVTDSIEDAAKDVKAPAQDFANAVQDGMTDIDLSELDTKIQDATDKYESALKDFNDTETLARSNPYANRPGVVDAAKNALPQKTKALEEAKKQLEDLKNQRAEIAGEAPTQTATTNAPQIQAETNAYKEATQAAEDLKQAKQDVANTPISSGASSAQNEAQQYQSMFAILDKVKGKKLEIADEGYAAKTLDAMNKAKAEGGQEGLMAFLNSLEDGDDAIGRTNSALKAYAATTKDVEFSMTGATQATQAHNTAVQASSGAAKAATIAHQALNAAIGMGIGLLISAAISVATQLWDKYANAAENAAERAKDALNTYKDSQKTLRDQQKGIAELSEAYEKLSKGVDVNTNDNINLATSDYQTYLDVCNDIADMYPELVTGFDAQGNAILSLRGNVDGLTQSYEDAARASRQAILTASDDIFDTFSNKYDSSAGLFNKETGLKQQLEYAEKLQEVIGSGDKKKVKTFYYDYLAKDEHSKNVKNMLSAAGIDRGSIFTDRGTAKEDGFAPAAEKLKRFIKVVKNEMALAAVDVKTLIGAYIEDDSDFAQLNNKTQSLIKSIVSNFDSEFIHSNFNSSTELFGWVQDNLIGAFTNPQFGANLSNSVLDAFDLQKLFEQGSLSVQEYKNQMLHFTSQLANSGVNEDVQRFILSMFDIGENAQYGDKIQQMVSHAQSLFADSASHLKENVMSLSYSDLEIINSEHFNIDIATLTSWDELIARIREVRSMTGQNVVSVQTFSATNAGIASYNDLLNQTSEVVLDNTEVTQEYKDALLGLGISAESLNECFYENNKLVVKDAKALNNLIKSAKSNTLSNIRLAKSQASLQYYELYKEMISLKDEQGNYSDAVLGTVESLYGEMAAISQTIAKYSMLEQSLLGAADAYREIEAAREADNATDYGTQAEDLVKTLGEAFVSAELGTEAAQVAIKGLIPESVFADADTLDEKMQKIYDYFTNGEISQLFTIEFNEEGGITGVEMSKENVENFVDTLLNKELDDGAGTIFEGTAEHFTLNPQIQSLEDFAEATNLSKEAAFAFLTSLERYDISWLDGDGTSLLDHFMGDDLEYQIYSTTQQMAELDRQFAKGQITAAEYTRQMDGLDGALRDGHIDFNTYQYEMGNLRRQQIEGIITIEEYNRQMYGLGAATGVAARENVKSWSETSESLQNAKNKLNEYYDTLNSATQNENGDYVDANDNIIDIDALQQNIDDTMGEINTLEEELAEIGQPTELVFKFAIDQVQKEMGKIEDSVDGLKENANNRYYQLNTETGEYEVTYVASSATDQTFSKIQNYVNLLNEEQTLEVAMGESATSTVDTLQNIATTLENIATLLSQKFGIDVETDGALENVRTFQDAWDAIKSKTVTLTQRVTTFVQGAQNFLGNIFGGGNDVNGTAHAQGTTGSWGAAKTETALVGELGPELRVRGSQWSLIGQNGAEFTDIKKGDIIFNHKQTEDLLKNGYITGRGKAYAYGTSGSAYSYVHPWDTGMSLGSDYSNTSGSEIKKAAGKLSGAADDISDSVEELKDAFDWIEVRLEEINEDISLKSAKLENTIGSSKQNVIIDDMITLNQRLYDNLIAGASEYYAYAEKLLAKVPEEYRKAAQDGSIAIEAFTGEAGEKTLEAIQEYRDWVQKGADATQQAEETLTEISNLAKQAIDNIVSEYENKASMPTIKIEQLEAYNSLIETTSGYESAKIYEAMIKENNKHIQILEQQRNKMQSELNAQVDAGRIKKYSQAWYDAVNDIAAVDNEIIELTTDTEGYQDSINELHWEHFDSLISRFKAISDEAENLIDILGSEDLVDKDTGEWTDEGITSLGLYAQQMEVAEMQAAKYREEIDYLNKNWKKLGYTEKEYVEKLEELKSGQYDSIKAYNDTKKAIKDLTSERIDAIKEGIDKEIEAYEELINKKKEELDAEKDLYDFQRGVADQQKEISDIERKLAALSADNSASARAKRAQLEADLAKAREELQETYYDRSIEDQQNALDKELENFQEEKEKEKEGWDEYLENTEQVVADSLETVQANTEVVYQTLQSMGQEYSLSIAEAITSPWVDGEVAIQNYSEQFGLAMSSTVEELQTLAAEYKKVMSEIDSAGKEAVSQVNNNVQTYKNEKTSTNNETKKSDDSKQTSNTIKVGGKVNAGSAKIYSYIGDKTGTAQYYSKDPIYTVLKIDGDWVQVRHKSLNSGITGWFKKGDIKAYAKGTTGVSKDQLAWIDELGEELVLRPQNGRLSFMEKGTSVIPADLTSNLMEWGELDPSVMLERNRPEIKLHPEVHNTEVNISMDIAEVVHVDRVDHDTMPDLTKAVEKQLDKYMKNLNNQIRRYVR